MKVALLDYLEEKMLKDVADQGRSVDDICGVFEDLTASRNGRVGFIWLFSVENPTDEPKGGYYEMLITELHQNHYSTKQDFSEAIKLLNQRYGEKS